MSADATSPQGRRRRLDETRTDTRLGAGTPGDSLAERIRRVVDRAPPLTADQLSQIRDLLPPPPGRRDRSDGADVA